MDEKQRDQEISDVIREEQSRGRRPVDTDEIRSQRERRENLKELIGARDLAGAISALRETGRTEEQIAEFVKLWKKLLP